MKIVLDTNVLVSALLDVDSNCGRILDLVLSGKVQVVYDSRIIHEYREVLQRPKFRFNLRDIEIILEFIEAEGEAMVPSFLNIKLADESDRPFVECALDASLPLVTGNKKHFQGIKGLQVRQPKDFMEKQNSTGA